VKLEPHETELVGKWVAESGQVRADGTTARIEWLTSDYLRKVVASMQSGGWDTLFQDPNDGRYWERIYPQSYMHGGGPPMLRLISIEQAKAKYGDEIV
jgi:hypothetical protein